MFLLKDVLKFLLQVPKKIDTVNLKLTWLFIKRNNFGNLNHNSVFQLNKDSFQSLIYLHNVMVFLCNFVQIWFIKINAQIIFKTLIHILQDTPVDKFEWLMRINYLGSVFCTKAVLPGMKQRRKGMQFMRIMCYSCKCYRCFP